MVELKSKTFSSYYGVYPNEYYLKFVHHDIKVEEDNVEEYSRIKQDLDNIYKFDNKAFTMYFSNVNNYLHFVEHINIQDLYKNSIYLRIYSIEDYKRLKESKRTDGVKVIVYLSDLEILNITDLDLVIQIDRVSELSLDNLKKLLSRYRIKEILVGQMSYLSQDDLYLYDIMSEMYGIDSSKREELEQMNKITNDVYSVAEYVSILNEFHSILSSLDKEDQIDSFYRIFNYIANTVSYDEDGVIETNIDNQTLIGSVLNGKAVCEGFSKYLQQLLSLIGIESVIVQSGSNKEDGGHVWNQVLINNKWYNADVTAASFCIKNNQEINTCLVKDSSLLNVSNSSIANVCDENFGQENIIVKK